MFFCGNTGNFLCAGLSSQLLGYGTDKLNPRQPY